MSTVRVSPTMACKFTAPLELLPHYLREPRPSISPGGRRHMRTDCPNTLIADLKYTGLRSRVDPTIFERSFARTLGLSRLLILEKLPRPDDRDLYLKQRPAERGRPEIIRHYRNRLIGNIKEQHSDDVVEWVEQEGASNYHTFQVPYGPRFHARKVSHNPCPYIISNKTTVRFIVKQVLLLYTNLNHGYLVMGLSGYARQHLLSFQIEKLLHTKDLLLNAEWNQDTKDRRDNLHRHP